MKIENYKEASPGMKFAAIFDVYLPSDQLTFRQIKLMHGKRGPWLAFPSFRDEETEVWAPYCSFSEEKQKDLKNKILELLKDFTRIKA